MQKYVQSMQRKNRSLISVMDSQQKLQAIQQHIDTILTTLSWNRDELKRWYTEEQSQKAQCSFDNRHYVYRDKLAQHEKRCRDKQLGVKRQPPELPSSARYFYKQPSSQENLENTVDNLSRGPFDPEVPYGNETSLEQASSNKRDIKRRPKAYRVRVTKYRKPIEIQRQMVQAYMQEFQ